MASRLVVMLLAGLLPLAVSAATAMRLQSPAFGHTTRLPTQYTCDGTDLSPPLEWGPLPEGTKSLAIVVEDPTVVGGNFVHWVVYDLPASTRSLAEGVEAVEKLPNGARQGRNDFGTIGYRGPCPSPGKVHDYWFRVYALDGPLEVRQRPTGRDVLQAMLEHTVGVAEVMGSYGR
jgi:Raf kinase inhibitor-like YbhB/YbcL family protein